MLQTKTAATPAFFPYKPGDKVRVTRKVNTLSEGWRNSWVEAMDQAVGKEGEVVAVYPNNNDVHIRVPLVGVYGFPLTGIEPVKITLGVSEPNPTLKTTIVSSSRRGQARAAARQVAVQIALSTPNRTVDADQVQAELNKLGFKSTDLGNAAGTIFKGKQFVAEGMTRSTRQGNNSRKITVWKFVDLAPQVVSPISSPKFVIEFTSRSGGTIWRRSQNRTTDGRLLSSVVFTNKAEAEKEASHQQNKSFGNRYRVTTV